MRKVTILCLSVLSVLNLLGQEPKVPSVAALEDSVRKQITLFPQEKIHLHTDRDRYVPGEKIWFKAYVTDAQTHQSPTYSRYVYVELISNSDSLITRVMVRKDENELYHGHLFLSDLIPEGIYTIRAYTRYMEQMGDDYFFKKPVQIGHLPDETEQKEKKEERRKRSRDDYDVSFFPEGGQLVDSLFCKVAFKALNKNGYSESVTGRLVDHEGIEICESETAYAGMGSFVFMPLKGKHYFFECKNRDGLQKRFELPAERGATSIYTAWRNRHHFISVKKSPNCPQTALYLLVQSQGFLLHFSLWDPKNEFIVFPEEGLPPGVIQFLLFDQEMHPLSERLVFNKRNEQAIAVFSTDRAEYEKRDKVTAVFSVTDKENKQLAGHLSVSITDDKDVAVDSLTTILSSLLLSSELKGYIESPGYYLQENTQSQIALDLLMMTHGWRRYDLPAIFKGNYTYPEKGFEETKEISGTVKSLLLGKPVDGGDVLVLSSDGAMGDVQTDVAGHFELYGFEYPDSTSFFVQAKNQKGKNRVELLLDMETFPERHAIPCEPYADQRTDAGSMDEFLQKAGERAKYDEDIRIINLKEVEVTAKRIPKKDEGRLQFWANTSSDMTIYREQIEKRSAFRVIDLLRNVAGVMVYDGGKISIRGAKGLPLVIIDGMYMEWSPDGLSPLELINVNDLESIDIFKGASASLFGMRGMDGAISLTTRRGESYESSGKTAFNYAIITPIGYQQPIAFYAPKYDTPTAKNLRNPDYRTTLLWKPDLLVTEDGKASFEFYTADFPTTYSVVIEGLTNDGKIIRQVERITVR